MGAIIFGTVAIVWNVSAEREIRFKKPEPDRWTRQLKEWDAEDKAAAVVAPKKD
ncbi:hypothetical protein Cpir12675_001127 [Ceratocystis pirilliformis]|uniref:Uncharacterized protein n=1 Tax=Ceratocystis pirilliformis TaxID=259994 RepID=A0ABR3ZI83_9PEZI